MGIENYRSHSIGGKERPHTRDGTTHIFIYTYIIALESCLRRLKKHIVEVIWRVENVI